MMRRKEDVFGTDMNQQDMNALSPEQQEKLNELKTHINSPQNILLFIIQVSNIYVVN